MADLGLTGIKSFQILVPVETILPPLASSLPRVNPTQLGQQSQDKYQIRGGVAIVIRFVNDFLEAKVRANVQELRNHLCRHLG
jgi:hypothetical protein